MSTNRIGFAVTQAELLQAVAQIGDGARDLVADALANVVTRQELRIAVRQVRRGVDELLADLADKLRQEVRQALAQTAREVQEHVARGQADTLQKLAGIVSSMPAPVVNVPTQEPPLVVVQPPLPLKVTKKVLYDPATGRPSQIIEEHE